jgi:hypothetical protein
MSARALDNLAILGQNTEKEKEGLERERKEREALEKRYFNAA